MLGQDTIIFCLDDCSGLSPKWSWHFHPCPCLFSVGQPETINHVLSLPCLKSSNDFPLQRMKPEATPTASRAYVIGSWILLHPNLLLSVTAPARLVWEHRHLLQGLCTCCTHGWYASPANRHISVFHFIQTSSRPLFREASFNHPLWRVSSLFPSLLDFLITGITTWN